MPQGGWGVEGAGGPQEGRELLPAAGRLLRAGPRASSRLPTSPPAGGRGEMLDLQGKLTGHFQNALFFSVFFVYG